MNLRYVGLMAAFVTLVALSASGQSRPGKPGHLPGEVEQIVYAIGVGNPLTPGPFAAIVGLQSSPTNRNVMFLFALTEDGQCWRSIDDGNNWFHLYTIEPQEEAVFVRVTALEEEANIVIWVSTSTGEAWRSIDAGVSWTLSDTLEPIP